MQSFSVGIVKQDNNGNSEGYSVLLEAFNELNDAYMSANDNQFSLVAMEFETNEDLNNHVHHLSYIETG